MSTMNPISECQETSVSCTCIVWYTYVRVCMRPCIACILALTVRPCIACITSCVRACLYVFVHVLLFTLYPQLHYDAQATPPSATTSSRSPARGWAARTHQCLRLMSVLDFLHLNFPKQRRLLRCHQGGIISLKYDD